jgi:hypothetical protein
MDFHAHRFTDAAAMTMVSLRANGLLGCFSENHGHTFVRGGTQPTTFFASLPIGRTHWG